MNGADLLREMDAANRSMRRVIGGRRILSAASGIVATSAWVGRWLRHHARVRHHSVHPIGVFDLGTDPVFFNRAGTRATADKWRIGNDR